MRTAVPAVVSRAVDVALEGTVVLSFGRAGHAVRSRLEGWTSVTDLPGRGRRVLITGANSGLGYATARGLLRAGAEVLLVVRSAAKGEDALARLRVDLGRDVADAATWEVADLADLTSVRALADRVLGADARPDVVVHNAGAMFPERRDTVDGLEHTYQVHVVAPFLLTARLLPALVAAAPSRVITVTSGGMYAERLDAARVDSPDGFRPALAYARAKRAQVALTAEAAARCGAAGIAFHSVHPGWVLTPGVEASLPRFRRLAGPLLRAPDQGADTIAYLCMGDVDELGTGRLWHDRRPRAEHRVPWTRAVPGEGVRLWERVCGDAGVEPRC